MVTGGVHVQRAAEREEGTDGSQSILLRRESEAGDASLGEEAPDEVSTHCQDHSWAGPVTRHTNYGGREMMSLTRRALALAAVLLCATLLGTPASAETYRTYLLGGQSNADGYALGIGEVEYGTLDPNENLGGIGRSDLEPAHPDVKIYRGAYNSGNGSWPQLAAGFGITWNGSRFGPELAFGHAIQSSKGGKIAIVKYAHGATGLAAGAGKKGDRQKDWDPTYSGSNQYDYFLATVANAKAAAQAAGDTLDIVGMLWMQGESDSRNATHANAYETNLTSFIASVRSDLELPELEFYIGTIADSGVWTHREVIWAAQEAVAARDPKAFVVNGKDLPLLADDADGDGNIHYTAAGQVTLGERFAAAAAGAGHSCAR